MRTRALAVLAALALLALAGGCGRRTRVEFPPADSLGAVRVDSAVIVVRQAQQAWDAPGGGEAAARASARALQLVLTGALPEDWGVRAQGFLDSLGVGAEVAPASCALAVNFFSRADPNAGSWPYLFWCGAKGPEFQAVEGRSMRLLKLVSRGLHADGARDTVPPTAAALFDRRAALGTEPYLTVWSHRGPTWQVAQTLGPDSLGGAGTGEFEAHGDSVALVTRTYRSSRGFDECATCPHVYRVRRFIWRPAGFVGAGEEEAPSPYSTFVRFVQALTGGDRETAEALVTDRALADAARRAGFGQSKGLWRVAPSTDETATHMVFLRGASEAYDVEFVPRGEQWLVNGIRTTETKVE